MWWVVGLLLLMSLDSALAQEGAAERDLEAKNPFRVYEQAIVRFNTNIQAFPSWEAFKAKVFAMIAPDTMGSCYELTKSTTEPVQVTEIPFQPVEDAGWRKTSGKGWRQKRADRTFIEYRVNEKTQTLLRVEGVKPRFFFARTRKICEFPLTAAR